MSSAEASVGPRSAPRAQVPPDAGARRFQFTGSLQETSVYLERAADRELVEHLLRGDYCHVLAPRQIGKSSLRVRVARKLAQEGVRCASIDLTSVGTAATPEEWYFGLVDEVASRLGLGDPLAFWEANRGAAPSRRWADYLRQVLAEALAGQRVVVMFDEIEAVRTVPFPMDDFFTQIRALYEARSSDEVCRRITFCLVGVTTPNDLIKDKLITPFNVSHGIRLEDFSRKEMAALAPELAAVAANVEALISAIHAWTDGHPYMTMRTCAALVERGRVAAGEEGKAVEAVVRKEFLDRPLEDANLNYAARRFDDPSYEQRGATLTDKVSLYKRVQGGEAVPSDVESAVEMELRLAGMVKDVADDGRRVLRPRNRIFTTAFDREWLRSKGDRRFISESVWKWLDEEKNEDFLLRGDALADAVEWARTAILSTEEADFLAASQREERERLERERTKVAEEVERILADKARVEREKEALVEEAERRVSRVTTRLWWVAGLVVLGGVAVGVLFLQARSLRLDIAAQQAEANRLKADNAKSEGLLASKEKEIAEKNEEVALAQQEAKATQGLLDKAKTDLATETAAVKSALRTVQEMTAEKDAAIKRAEAAEAQLKAAMPSAPKKR